MRALPLLLVAVLLTGCGPDRQPAAARAESPTTEVTAVPTTPVATTTPPRDRDVVDAPPTHKATPRSLSADSVDDAAVRRTAEVVTCPGLSGVSGEQVLLVVGSGSSATVRACEKRGGEWVSVLGALRGHVGKRGVAPPGAKREGDLRTPSGTYTLGLGFGQTASPGVAFPWRTTDSQDVWVDDSDSSLYNTWQRKPANGRWDSAEDLDITPYRYAQVIDYNTARTPGRGSAIFLHVDRGSGTAGCVSLPTSSLLKVLRWERPGARIVIR